jgi:hypothetical protein
MRGVLIVHNTEAVLVLVHRDGRVIHATGPGYVGMPLEEARLAATSVMRLWNPVVMDNDYPTAVEVPLP